LGCADFTKCSFTNFNLTNTKVYHFS
jgi:hypothetical protein